MAHYKKILVATDFNSGYLPVLKKAKALAEENHAALHLISVVPEVAFFIPESLSSLESIEEQFQQEITERCQEVKKQLNLEAEFLIKRGSPKNEIIQYAQDIKADLIIVGSHNGSSDLYLSIGSTVHAVLNRANCDILVVRV